MEFHQNIGKKLTTLILIALISTFLTSCNSKEPITATVSGPPTGQTVTADQRSNFAKAFGDRFSAKFGDAKVSTQGPDGKSLVITWTNVEKPFARQMAANEEIVKGLREMGFKRLILTDGSRSNWDVDLKN
jgi:hypothetical protein